MARGLRPPSAPNCQLTYQRAQAITAILAVTRAIFAVTKAIGDLGRSLSAGPSGFFSLCLLGCDFHLLILGCPCVRLNLGYEKKSICIRVSGGLLEYRGNEGGRVGEGKVSGRGGRGRGGVRWSPRLPENLSAKNSSLPSSDLIF